MNKIAQLLVAGLMIGSVLPAFAGPDWATIEAGRKAKQTAFAKQQAEAPAPAASQPLTESKDCPHEAPVMQLDHGPRATTPPYINAKRQAEYQAQMQACHDAMK